MDGKIKNKIFHTIQMKPVHKYLNEEFKFALLKSFV